MNTALTIRNYKKIKSATLENFGRVNWLVGRNSSGKTSVINAASHLNDGRNARTFCYEGGYVELQHNGKSRRIKWEPADKNPNHTSDEGDLNLEIIIAKVAEYHEMGANNVIVQEFKYNNLARETHEFLNESCRILGMPETAAVRDHRPDPWTNTPIRTLFHEADRPIEVPFSASGLRAFNNLRWLFEPLKDMSTTNADLILLLFEEPENNLHPELQKRIPDFVETILKRLDTKITDKLLCLISTHSPFIIGGVAELKSHTVYPMNDGDLIDLKMQPVPNSSGFPSHKCSQIIGQMLGGDITDLGYPENFILLEEASMQIILEAAKEKGLIKNVTFISASGVVRAAQLSQTFKEISRINTLLKCNPFYGSKYKLILDNRAKLPPDQRDIVQRIGSQSYNPLIELRKNDLEEYYSNMDVAIYSEFQKSFTNCKGDFKKESMVKKEFAERISDRIVTAADFSKLFEHELDLLLSLTP